MTAPLVPGIAMRDIADLLAPNGARRQPLSGFDADYVDIVDYIVRCTHRIWEEKNVALIRTHYTADCVIHTLAGEVNGAEAVLANTVKTLAAFPDRTLCADNVIWTGDDASGFYTSHRITSHMTNLGESDFGPASGRRATVATIADCVVRANRIREEWLVRDNFSLVLQLGFDPHTIAARGAADDRSAPLEARRWRDREIARVRSSSMEPSLDSTLSAASRLAAEAWHAIWNDRAFSRVRDVYSSTCRAQLPSGRLLFGHGEVIGFAVHLLAALPDARVTIDHVCAIPYVDVGHDVAIRWTLAGTHTGRGWHRAPTGLSVLVLGVTHWRVIDGRVTDEWTVFDELAVLRQLYGADQ